MKFKVLRIAVVALSVASGWGFAHAGPPPVCTNVSTNDNSASYTATSLSASEASTSQVMELLSQRRTEQALICPTGFEKVQGVCRPISPSMVSPGVKNKTAAAPSPPAKKAGEVAESEAPILGGWTGVRTSGAWAETFADYERRTVTGVQTQRAAGALFGIDQSMNAGGLWMRFGILGGFTRIQQNSTAKKTEISDTDYTVTIKDGGKAEPDKTITFTVEDVHHNLESRSRQTLDGTGIGFSASLSKGRFFVDALAKVDFFDVRGKVQSSDSAGKFLAEFNYTKAFMPDLDDNGDPRDLPLFALAASQKSTLVETTLKNFVIGSNFGYRSDLPNGYWLEPTVGVRLTYSDLGDSASELGLQDGHALRLEAGARLGKAQLLNDGSMWSNALGLFVYSDVIVDGFVIDAVGSSFQSDEGKLRLRGAFQSRLDWGMAFRSTASWAAALARTTGASAADLAAASNGNLCPRASLGGASRASINATMSSKRRSPRRPSSTMRIFSSAE